MQLQVSGYPTIRPSQLGSSRSLRFPDKREALAPDCDLVLEVQRGGDWKALAAGVS